MVESDVLALEVRRLRAGLAAAAEEVASLENRQAQMRYSMEERKAQVAVSSCYLPVLNLRYERWDDCCTVWRSTRHRWRWPALHVLWPEASKIGCILWPEASKIGCILVSG